MGDSMQPEIACAMTERYSASRNESSEIGIPGFGFIHNKLANARMGTIGYRTRSKTKYGVVF